MMTRFSLSDHAEALADKMHELAVWSKSHPNSQRFQRGLLKLPPVFSSEKHGDPRGNLVAMIKTLADYEESEEGLKLAELPMRYNEHGGMPAMEERDLRKVHNWLQQVSFGVRAAMIAREIEQPTADLAHLDTPERVYQLLFAACPRRVFVTYAADNRYELKPLRYADANAKRRWLKQEYAQLSGQRTVTAGTFGARPSQEEWDVFGLRGQMRTVFSSVSSQIEELVKQAESLDSEGRYDEADALDFRLKQLSRSLEGFEQVQA
jgi:hypothetical protein